MNKKAFEDVRKM